MCYENYLKYLLETCDDIYIDTSTLMNVDALRKFLETGKEEFLNTNKKIIVTAAVFSELKNHQKYDFDANKRGASAVAMELIGTYQTIFKIENNVEEMGVNYICADRDFLARLTFNKVNRKQLLITNDRKLGQDAYKINEQESNRGNRIMVCYINFYGGICRCTCTKNKKIHVYAADFQERVADNKKSIVNVSHRTLRVTNPKSIYWKYAFAFAGGLASGIAIDKLAVSIIKKTLLSA